MGNKASRAELVFYSIVAAVLLINVLLGVAASTASHSATGAVVEFQASPNSTSSTTTIPNVTSTSSATTTVASSTSTTILALFNTSFTENGLPAGTSWNVTYAGTRKLSNTQTIVFPAAAGNYSFQVSNVYLSATNALYLPSRINGTVYAGNTVQITFSLKVQQPPNSTTSTSTSTSTVSSSTTTTTIPVNAATTTTINTTIQNSTTIAANLTASNSTMRHKLSMVLSNYISRNVILLNSTPSLNGSYSLTRANIQSVLGMVKASGVNATIQNVSTTVTYGSVFRNGSYVRTGGRLNFSSLNQSTGVLTFYSVNITKARPNAFGLVVNGQNITNPGTYQVPIVITPFSTLSYYWLNVSMTTSLLGQNRANFTYSIVLSNGTVLAPRTSVNAGSISKTFSSKISNKVSANVTFDFAGNANYTPLDPSAITTPTQIGNYIPVNIVNSRAIAFSANSQIEITFNALKYESYESVSMNNVMFFYANGTTIPSWLEGNGLNEQQTTDLSTSKNVIYWLLIPTANTFLGASVRNTIYIGFAPVNTNLFNGTSIGEAPQLTTPYGEYDNGANIFIYYTNFEGDTLPSGWNSIGVKANVIVSNGIHIGAASGANSIQFASGNIVEGLFNIQASGNGGLVFGIGGSAANAVGNWLVIGTGANALDNGASMAFNTVIGTNSLKSVSKALQSNALFGEALGSNVLGIAVNTPIANTVFFKNEIPVNQITGANVPAANTFYIGLLSSATANTAFTANWIRIRTFTPNGIQPTVNAIGSVLTPLSITINTPATVGIDTGQTIAFTANVQGGPLLANVPTLTYQWLTANSLNSNVCDSTGYDSYLSSNTATSRTNTIIIAPQTGNYYCASATGTNFTKVYTPTTQVTINPALAPTLTASNALVDAGQYEVFTATVGGTSPYTYNYLVVNSISNAVVNSIVYTGVLQSSNTFTWLVPSSIPPNTIKANVIVTDNSFSSVKANSVYTSNILTHLALGIPTITPDPSLPDTLSSGESIVYTASWTGGNAPYLVNYTFVDTANSGILFSTVYSGVSTTSNTFTWVIPSEYAGNTIETNVSVNDSATTEATQNSIYTNILTVASLGCQISLSNSIISFSSLAPGSHANTANLIDDTNSGSAPTSIYIYGTNWIGPGSANFFVTNTLWNPTSLALYAGNALTLAPANTGLTIPANTGTAKSNSLFFGVEVPGAAPSGAYTQNIVIENSC